MESFVVISEHAQDVLTRLKFFMGDDRILPCKLLSADSAYYLHLELSSDDPKIGGTVLIPHSSVSFIGTNTTEKKLGFV